jgi:glyoxylase-like metal-dependent hydrolase (beta-lactamase superfamily II)
MGSGHMRIHHLNCGMLHPFGLPRKDGSGGFFVRGGGALHCLLIKMCEGLVLIDTGWGQRDCTEPSPAMEQFMALAGCAHGPEETAVHQIRKRNRDPADVTHVFLTHMHLDHAGGPPDFPQAEAHLLAVDLEACLPPARIWKGTPTGRSTGRTDRAGKHIRRGEAAGLHSNAPLPSGSGRRSSRQSPSPAIRAGTARSPCGRTTGG